VTSVLREGGEGEKWKTDLMPIFGRKDLHRTEEKKTWRLSKPFTASKKGEGSKRRKSGNTFRDYRGERRKERVANIVGDGSPAMPHH